MFLFSALENHCDISNIGALFGTIYKPIEKKKRKLELVFKGIMPLSFILIKTISVKERNILFKIFESHYQHIHRRLLKNKDFAFIILERKNYLASYVSKKIAIKTGVWGIRNSSTQSKVWKVKVNINKLNKFVNENQKYYSKIKKKVTKSIYIKYNNLIFDNEKTINNILDFSGLRKENLKSNFHKQGSNNVLDHIINKDEVIEYCKSIGHEDWIEYIK